VPLIIRHPHRVSTGSEMTDLVSLVDLAPTIFEAAEIDPSVMPHPLQGESLLRPAQKGGRDYAYYEFQVMPMKQFLKRKHFPRIFKAHKDLNMKDWFRSYTAIQNETFKLVKDSRGQIRLYHLPSDALESIPVNEAYPDIYRTMLAELESQEKRLMAQALEESRGEVAEETRDQLRALGYLQ